MSKIIKTPDLGVEQAEVIELLVASGDKVVEGQGLVLVESDKASMEIPSPVSGELIALKVAIGNSIREGTELAEINAEDSAADTVQQEESLAVADKEPEKPTQHELQTVPEKSQDPIKNAQTETPPDTGVSHSAVVYAGPGVRKLARELGVDLALVTGTGARSRILNQDVHDYVKQVVNNPTAGTGLPRGSVKLDGSTDFSLYGEIDTQSMSKLRQLTADAMVQSWISVPRVTQFDQTDITELEAFRKETNDLPENKEQGVRLTLLSFLVKASVRALQKYPQFNVSVDGHRIISKSYYNIGIAVDTPAGLVVPIVKDADSKNLVAVARNIGELASKAREKTLSPQDMQGGSFTISSLGGIGGTGFTPMVNYPEAAIMGVANSSIQPVWNGSEFTPRLICPLSLSYDHRAVNGADAARFLSYIASLMGDIRKLLL